MNNSSIISEVTSTIVNNSAPTLAYIDPNWFYSAIAQSSAAIVGIMGAFLTSRIINQRSAISTLQNEIHDNNKKMEFLKKRIFEKKQWVERIDEEENMTNVKDFLKEIRDDINPDNPPTINELIEKGNQDENEDYHNLPRNILESNFNEEYLAELRERQRKRSSPFGMLNIDGLMLDKPILINPNITGRKWDRYRRYSDEIYATGVEIDYLSGLNNTKNEELTKLMEANEVKKTLLFLGGFSILGVFAPLGIMMTQNNYTMNLFLPYTFWIIFGSWTLILFYFTREIIQLNHKIHERSKNGN